LGHRTRQGLKLEVRRGGGQEEEEQKEKKLEGKEKTISLVSCSLWLISSCQGRAVSPGHLHATRLEVEDPWQGNCCLWMLGKFCSVYPVQLILKRYISGKAGLSGMQSKIAQ